MKNYTMKNDWDNSFLIQGTLDEICFYFDLEEQENIIDVLEFINNENNGNGSIYYISDVEEI